MRSQWDCVTFRRMGKGDDDSRAKPCLEYTALETLFTNIATAFDIDKNFTQSKCFRELKRAHRMGLMIVEVLTMFIDGSAKRVLLLGRNC